MMFVLTANTLSKILKISHLLSEKMFVVGFV